MEHAIETLSHHQIDAQFDNGSIWDNFVNLTSTHLGVNVSRYTPSLEDLVWAGPRMVMRLGRLGSFISIPDAIDGFGQRLIPDATGSDIFSTSAALNSDVLTTHSTASAVPSNLVDPDPIIHRFSMEGARGLGSIFSYATSKWALCCIAMAVVLNRTHIFAATRRRLRLHWHVRLALRIVPLVLFFLQARSILQSIQCQTSPDFAELRWGNASRSSDLMFSQHNAFLHGVSSSLLLGATDMESCSAIHMIPVDDEESPELKGSLTLLWPLFGSFCVSQFLETISCAVQGRPVSAETGMTLFEHSLAFAEADAAVSNQLGWGMFSSPSSNSTAKANLGTSAAISRSMILRRVNTPPEVLLIAFFSAMSHITSHTLGVFGKQAKFRLLSTGFWAVCYMGSIIWSAVTFSLDDPTRQGLLRYPTVCIIGFIPHVLVLIGIVVCSSIYSVALLLSALAKPVNEEQGDRPLSLKERIALAHANMQANLSFSDLRITTEMDFYTALLRAGFGAITMATEAVYLNEDRGVNLKCTTWLEEERHREIEELKMNWISSGVPGSRYDTSGVAGLIPVKDGQLRATSGYSRERAAQKLSRSITGPGRQVGDGIGAAERSSRWLLALDYILHINKLVLTTWAMVVCSALSKLGVQNPPRLLKNWSQLPKSARPEVKAPRNRTSYETVVQPVHGAIGLAEIKRSDRVDVEHEVRQRYSELEEFPDKFTDTAGRERWIDSKLYHWWLAGGWWGKNDTSGDYAPAEEENDSDFDATSVISATESVASMSDHENGFDWEDVDSNDDGQRTPTQRSPFASREGSPLVDTTMQATDLAALLHPRSAADRDQARNLAAHLSADRIMTRAGYQRFQQVQRAQLLFPTQAVRAAKMTPDEEAQLLEQILLERRAATVTDSGVAGGGPSSWATGAAGMGSDGPQCVVCQSSPRTVIVWPCRCLSLCDDCRVSLAMNNFDKCVCCRRDVMSFSKIYVP
ncbi:unnamed protein product [Discula destructiva]